MKKARPEVAPFYYALFCVNYIRAVALAKKPQTMPGRLATMMGQSFFFLKNPYPTQRVQLMPATKGCNQSPLCPLRFPDICGMYEIYIAIAVTVATQPRIIRNFDCS